MEKYSVSPMNMTNEPYFWCMHLAALGMCLQTVAG